MKKIILVFLLLQQVSLAQTTLFEKSKGTESPSYEEGIKWWEEFAKVNSNVTMDTFGQTDAGYPLHLISIGKEKIDWRNIKSSNKTVILINNAIHPGEPDGVDASMLFYKDLIQKSRMKDLLEKCIVVCIPYYNIGGSLNRSSFSRANQKGPSSYGFRGNAQNLDLNRDFIKCDSKNALSFSRLLQLLDPDIYLETHVSNGADYQYTITYLATQPDKLAFGMGEYLNDKIIPSLEENMFNKDEEMVPYVNHHWGPLQNEMNTFYDLPRYSTGLTTLHQTFGIITETHMLKNFRERVWATYKFMTAVLEFSHEHGNELKAIRKKAKESIARNKNFTIDWEIDTTLSKKIKFKGYAFDYKPSDVTGKPRLYYDRTKPVTKEMNFYHKLKPSKEIVAPSYYVLRKGFWEVEDRLRANGVVLIPLKKDSIIKVNSFIINSVENTQQPYEKHYYHKKVNYTLSSQEWPFRKGDFVIPMNTDKNRFILEVLEPEAPDAYFRWNFFDAILQQKEGYSDYVFEDVANELLQKDSNLKRRFEEKKKAEPTFESDGNAQLDWLYKNSPYYEKEHMRLPVFRSIK